jgi:membrane protease YdiL (CAAX protease family)
MVRHRSYLRGSAAGPFIGYLAFFYIAWTFGWISSILFVGAHIPGWIMLESLTARNIIDVFVFGAAMAIILRYSKSLWAPIITHSLNDCLSTLIFHI